MKESVRAIRQEKAQNRCLAALKEGAGEDEEKLVELENLKNVRLSDPDRAMMELEIMADVLEELVQTNVTQEDELLSVDGIGEETAADLRRRGIETKDDLRAASDEDLLKAPSIGPGRLKKIRASL